MAKEPIYLTAKGLEKIKEELKYLKEVKRDQLSEYMGSAIADGDLRESAAYDEARLLQSANETRIADLEEIVHRASVVEGQKGDNVAARLGSSLLMEDTSGKRETFYLVGTHEANFFENRISDESPLGKEFIGKRAGDKVKFKTIEYNVIEVKFE
jgi:transcription elongation factor GreA